MGPDEDVRRIGVVMLRRLAGLLLVLLLLVSSGLLPSKTTSVVRADSTIQVNSTTDSVDVSPGDGICETAPANGICTLRAAVQEANALSGAQTITLPSGTFTLTRVGSNEEAAATGDLDLTDSATIIGQGAGSTVIDGNSIDRVFHVVWRSGNEPAVTLQGLSIINGAVLDGNGMVIGQGGGILSEGTLTLDLVKVASNRAAAGGGIYSGRPLTIRDSDISDNEATNGGGIFSDNTLNVQSSLFSNNTGASNSGAGIDSRHSASVTNSTFSANQGIGFFQASQVSLESTILNSTFVGTSPSIDTNSSSGRVYIKNTLLAGQVNNCWSGQANQVISLGHNLERLSGGSATCNPNPGLGDTTASDPKVLSLANNGGLTRTHALDTGSPAIDAGTNDGCPSTDQRGYARPYDGDQNGSDICDIGAFEAPVSLPVATQTSTATPTATSTVTRTSTPTAAVVPSATQTTSPTITPTPGACDNRRPVKMSVNRSGSGTLQVTVTVGEGMLQSLRFAPATNAVVDIDGQTGRVGSFTVSLPPSTSQTTFTVRRLTAGPFTVPLTVVDGCGDWQTFVGAGSSLP